jgi:hypothetical protein
MPGQIVAKEVLMSASQVVEATAEGQARSWTEPGSEFEYRPVPALVSVAGAFAVFSLTAFIIDWLLLVPVVGILLAAVALWQIRRGAGAYGGRGMAWILIGIMALELGGAAGLYGYSFVTEVPDGYQRVSFVNDISKFELKTVNGQMQIPEPVQELDAQPVFLKGYMYPTREDRGLTRFVLCKDMGQCCFGGNPKPTDMIVIEMDKKHRVDYRTGMVSVAGVFRTHADVGAAGLNPVYKLDCSYFNVAKTSY